MNLLSELGISRVSVHEAAHAAVAMYYRCYVDKISKIPDEPTQSLGRIRYYGNEVEHFAHSVIHVSGELALKMFSETPDLVTAGSQDLIDIKKLYSERGGNPEGFIKYVELAIEEATYILNLPQTKMLLILLAVDVENNGEINETDIKNARDRLARINNQEILKIFN